jgi:hypothetical protein
LQKFYRNIGFRKKRQFFRQKFAQIAENLPVCLNMAG